MTFLYPYFLGALAFVAIPIIIHLFRFRRYKKIVFSDIAFLKVALTESHRRQRLRHLLMLALRLLAIILLVGAFAFPVARNFQLSGGTQYVSLFIDNSLSMDQPGQGGTLLDEARTRAEKLMKTFGEDARFQVLAASPLPGGGRFTGMHDALNQVAALRPEPASRNFSAVLRRISTDTREAGVESSRHTVVFLSDFQKHIADFENISFTYSPPARWLWIPIMPARKRNVAVDSAWSDSGFPLPGQSETFRFRLWNTGEEEVNDVPVEFFLNGEKKSATVISIPPRANREAAFTLSMPQGAACAELRLEDGAAVFDNSFFVCSNFSLKRKVLVWWEAAPTALLKALATEPQFDVEAAALGQAVYKQLEKADILFLAGVKNWTTGLATVVQDFVRRGGTAVLFPPDDSDGGADAIFANTFNLQWPGSRQESTVPLAPYRRDLPFFAGMLNAEGLRVKMPEARRWYLQNWPAAEKLLTFSDGSAFWQRLRMGGGWLVSCAVPLEPASSDFTRHGLFVPLVLRTVIESRPDAPLYYDVGRDAIAQPLELTLAPEKSTEGETPFRWESESEADYNFTPEQVVQEDRVSFRFSFFKPHPGIYRVMHGDSLLTRIAVNAPGPESRPDYPEISDLQKIANEKSWNFVEVWNAGSEPDSVRLATLSRHGYDVWLWLLLGAAAALLTESLLSRGWTKGRKN